MAEFRCVITDVIDTSEFDDGRWIASARILLVTDGPAEMPYSLESLKGKRVRVVIEETLSEAVPGVSYPLRGAEPKTWRDRPGML